VFTEQGMCPLEFCIECPHCFNPNPLDSVECGFCEKLFVNDSVQILAELDDDVMSPTGHFILHDPTQRFYVRDINWKFSYELGIKFSKEKDYPRALRCFLHASKNGNRQAYGRIAFIVRFNMDGLTHEREEVFFWTKHAAEVGETLNQKYLALMYYNGDGIKKNKEEAHRWFSIAADRGDKESEEWKQKVYEEIQNGKS
jgi:hypothetical protein